MDDEVLDGWIGPAIYDGEGHLVYSGAPAFDNSNTEDFRVSNVGGKDMLTVMDQTNWRGVLMDLHFVIKRRIQVIGRGGFNSHDFNFVENGTKALVLYDKGQYRSEEESAMVGFKGRCKVGCNGIAEYDTKTWEMTFDWTSCGNILLNESTADRGDFDWLCVDGWDYVHANSIDKTPEGDYLYSCRHCDAIYKISHKTGEIMWRLGGKQSDFEMIDDLRFTRQHHIRFRGYNGTHTMVSMMDNALGQDRQEPSFNFSRGLILALDETNEHKTASIVTQYDHPEGEGHYCNRRGNLQVLPNGNVLMGWSERGQMSEHLADGTIIMRAYFSPRWLGTYRSYKQEFVGWPARRPDAAAEAEDVNSDGGTQTTVYASWNGATEVSTWNFYKTNPLGHHEVSLGSAKKVGFETSLLYDGFAKYVVAEAVHRNGTVLGRSKVVTTSIDDDSTEAVEAEEQWQADVTPLWWKIEHSLWFIGSAGLIIGIAVLRALFSGYRKAHAAWPKDLIRRIRLRNVFRRRRVTIPRDNDIQFEDRPAWAGRKSVERDKWRRSDIPEEEPFMDEDR